MGHTILVDFKTFENDILGVKPSLAIVNPLPETLVNHARLIFDKAFGRAVPPTEDVIADHFIKVINARSYGGLLNHHRAAFTGNHTSADGSTSKVDAGLYLNEHVPVTVKSTGGKPSSGKPNWNRIKLFIKFKRESTSLDPFDDYESDTPEASAQSRQAVRHQITNYALDIRNRQHRTCIYGLFIIGPQFRLMRFDQSGVIVSKRKDYAKDPRPLLSFLAWFDKLSPEQQGYDPTATMLTEGSRAYKLMDEFSEDQASDMPHAEESRVPATSTPPTSDPSASGPAKSPYHTRQKTKAATASLSNDDESYLDDIDPSDEDPRVFKYVREKFRQSLENGWPRFKLEVGEEKRIFLVGKPIWTASWLFGRGTRGYIGLDVKTRRFVFLKDCWRPFYEGLKSEGSYLEILNADGTTAEDVHVPALIVHGDVAGQVTMTAQYANHLSALAKQERERTSQQAEQLPPSASSGPDEHHTIRPVAAPGSQRTASGPEAVDAEGSSSQPESEVIYRHFTHYRIVVKDVCLPFTEIISSKQLVELLIDCVTAHSLAYTNHRLLHRDISAGNVIIRPSLSADVDENGDKAVIWEGVLTDWELAKEIPIRDPSDPEAPKEVPRQPERTGTWQFMSVHYVRNHPKCPVSVADELESFFHVLLFYAVRLLHHNITNVPSFVAEYFDSYAVTGQIKRSCSAKKSTAMDDGVIRVTSQGVPLQFQFADGNPHSDFNDLIGDLLQYFKARYEVLAWESRKLQEKPDPAVPSLSNAPAASAPPKPGPNKNLKRRRQLVNLAQVGVQSVRQEKGEPSDDTKARAKHLDDHSVFLATLGNAIDPERSRPDRVPVWPVWPETDVVEDRLPDKYDPRILASMFNEMYTASGLAAREVDPAGAPPRKKLRTDISEPSKPPRPRQSTRARTVGGSSGNTVGGAAGSGKGKARALD